MALIKCPECDKEISDSAKICPNCGYNLLYKKFSINLEKLIKNKIVIGSFSLVLAILLFLIIKDLSFDYTFKKYGKVGEYSKTVEEAYANRHDPKDFYYTVTDDAEGGIIYRLMHVKFMGREGEIHIYTDKNYVIKRLVYQYKNNDDSLDYMTDEKVYDALYSDAKEYYDKVLKRYTKKLGNNYNDFSNKSGGKGVYWEKGDTIIYVILSDAYRVIGYPGKPHVQIYITNR